MGAHGCVMKLGTQVSKPDVGLYTNSVCCCRVPISVPSPYSGLTTVVLHCHGEALTVYHCAC